MLSILVYQVPRGGGGTLSRLNFSSTEKFIKQGKDFLKEFLKKKKGSDINSSYLKFYLSIFNTPEVELLKESENKNYLDLEKTIKELGNKIVKKLIKKEKSVLGNLDADIDSIAQDYTNLQKEKIIVLFLQHKCKVEKKMELCTLLRNIADKYSQREENHQIEETIEEDTEVKS